MMQRKFHYLLLNAESKELEQKNQNNNQEKNMNIKKREEKRREDIYLSGGEPRKLKDSLKNVDILAMKKYMKKSHLL
jgi:hypothetical protein